MGFLSVQMGVVSVNRGLGGGGSDGGGSRLLWDSLRPVWMGNERPDGRPACRGSGPCGACSAEGADSRSWSLGLSSSHEPKADGDSLIMLPGEKAETGCVLGHPGWTRRGRRV